jgi:hypothetical protein
MQALTQKPYENTKENKMTYTPQGWIVVEITSVTGEKIEKVLATWGIDQWKLNSGNKYAEELPDRWKFHGYSGSIYVCYKDSYGTSAFIQDIYDDFERQLNLSGGSIKIVDKYNV